MSQVAILEQHHEFRSYRDFISRTLNPQHFARISVSSQQADLWDHASEKWFIYNCFRSPNQFTGRIDFGDAKINVSGGVKGGGKSALNGNIGSRYQKCVSAFGSRDDEVLADLRMHEYRDKVPTKISENIQGMEKGLIIRPPNTSVTSSWNEVDFEKLTLNDLEKHDIIVAPQRMAYNPAIFFRGSEEIVNLLWNRPSAEGVWFLKVLEAANILYSRITLRRMKMEQAKAYLIFLMREMRHMGVATGLDFQYAASIDREVRTNADYTFIKNMGSDKLPKDISWMYRYVSPVGFTSLYPDEFVCKDKFGGVYLGKFMLPPWHKKPKDNIYKLMGISYDIGDPDDRLLQSLNPTEDVLMHNKIVEAFYDTANAMSYMKIKGTARFTGHDPDTVRRHMTMHRDHKCSCFKSGAPSKMSDGLSGAVEETSVTAE